VLIGQAHQRLQAAPPRCGDRRADEGDDRTDREDRDADHFERLHDMFHGLFEFHHVTGHDRGSCGITKSWVIAQLNHPGPGEAWSPRPVVC